MYVCIHIYIQGALTAAELTEIAKTYSRARDELRVVFEALPQVVK
jgi:hypothetical protein